MPRHPSGPDLAEHQKPLNANEADRSNRQLRLSVYLNCITAIGAIVGIVGLIFVYFSLNVTQTAADAARQQAETAQRSFESEQRARIAVTEASLGAPIEVGKPFSIFVSFQNVGKEPAVDVNIRQRTGDAPGPNIDLVSGVILPANNTCNGLEPLEGGNVLYPGVSGYRKGESWRDDSVDWNAHIQAILDRKLYAFVNGCAVYKTLGKPHHSAYCFYLHKSDVDAQWRFSVCQSGNSAD
jgi:hypothetical protein